MEVRDLLRRFLHHRLAIGLHVHRHQHAAAQQRVLGAEAQVTPPQAPSRTGVIGRSGETKTFVSAPAPNLALRLGTNLQVRIEVL